MVQQELRVLDQVVNPHGAVGRYAQDSLLIDSGAVVAEKHAVQGQEESGRRTDGRQQRS